MYRIKRWIFKIILRKNPNSMEMVKYWRTKESVQAKVTEIDGVICMKMEGEKYTFPGFPRGHLLYGKLSKLKHEVKNQIFNRNWYRLEEGKYTKFDFSNIFSLLEDHKYDMVPPKKMVCSVREIHRAWTKVSPETHQLRDLITYILQEDDSYRFRVQWIVEWMPTWLFRFINPVKPFIKSFEWLENAEVIDDMKERIRLLRRILEEFLKDPEAQRKFTLLFREIDWRKVKMSKADKYFFRGKYFKVDLDKFEY